MIGWPSLLYSHFVCLTLCSRDLRPVRVSKSSWTYWSVRLRRQRRCWRSQTQLAHQSSLWSRHIWKNWRYEKRCCLCYCCTFCVWTPGAFSLKRLGICVRWSCNKCHSNKKRRSKSNSSDSHFSLFLIWRTKHVCSVGCPTEKCVLMCSQVHLLKLSSLSPDLERVNELVYRLPVSDRDVKRLQSLNRSWATHSAHLTERFRYLKPSNFTCSTVNFEQSVTTFLQVKHPPRYVMA